MEKVKLEKLILENKSIATMAKDLNVSIHIVRYWLKKYNLKTNLVFGGVRTIFKNCAVCNKETSNGKMYCSNLCKSRNHASKKSSDKITEDNIAARSKLNTKKKELVLYKGGKCTKCNYNKNYAALCFHHLDPLQKDFQISNIKNMRKNIDDLKKEVDKCDLLCCNCHCEVHSKDFYDNKSNNTYAKQKQKAAKVRQYLIDLKGSKCSICSYAANSSSLCFHHVNSNEKSFNIDARVCNGYPLAKLEDEAKKCLLLCHNCHMEIHYPNLTTLEEDRLS